MKKSDSTVFMYNKGFLSKVSRTPVSVDLVKLKLESVKELLGLDEDEVSDTSSHSGEVTDDADDLDMPDPASLEIDRKLVRLREDMKAEAERKNAELAKKFKEKSAELSEEAERAYREEVDRFAKQQDLEERNCLEQRQSKLIMLYISEYSIYFISLIYFSRANFSLYYCAHAKNLI